MYKHNAVNYLSKRGNYGYSYGLAMHKTPILSDSEYFKTFYTPLHTYHCAKSYIEIPSIKELNLPGLNTYPNQNQHMIRQTSFIQANDKRKIQVKCEVSTVGTRSKNEETLTRRQRLTESQKTKLNQFFQKEFFPTSQMRKKIAKELNIDVRSVQIWFQNKRQAWRRVNNSRERENPEIRSILVCTPTVPSSQLYIASSSSIRI